MWHLVLLRLGLWRGSSTAETLGLCGSARARFALPHPAALPPNGVILADRRYGEVYQEFHLDIEGRAAVEAGKHIRDSTVAPELAALLDDWAMLCRRINPEDEARWNHLLDVARSRPGRLANSVARCSRWERPGCSGEPCILGRGRETPARNLGCGQADRRGTRRRSASRLSTGCGPTWTPGACCWTRSRKRPVRR